MSTTKKEECNGKNVLTALSKLLSSENCQGRYCFGGELDEDCHVPDVWFPSSSSSSSPSCSKEEESTAEMICMVDDFPLTSTDLSSIKKAAEYYYYDDAEGINPDSSNRLNVSEARRLRRSKCWQITPAMGLVVYHDKFALHNALTCIQRELCTDRYYIEAHLCKLLLFEKGCYFAKHRDNKERLVDKGMFATLVLELPSIYQGGDLSVWSPLTPNEKTTDSYGSKNGKRRKQTTMKFNAFYSDCYREVGELVEGNRCVLVYNLTARPKDQTIPSIPPQPANHNIAQGIANCMRQFADEKDTETSFPTMFQPPVDQKKNDPNTWPFFQWPPGKPKKLALVLSHQYTPDSLKKGITALKGTDRAIAELIHAAAWIHPENGEEEDDDCAGKETGPYFDAFVSLALIYESGESTSGQRAPFRTTGPLVSIVQDPDTAPIPFDMGRACFPSDLNPAWRPTWHHHGVPPDSDVDPLDPWVMDTNYMELVEEESQVQAWNGVDAYTFDPYSNDAAAAGNHSLPIANHEILFASEQAFQAFQKHVDKHEHGLKCFLAEPEVVEFLGNHTDRYGHCLERFLAEPEKVPGRAYSRAVILMWPKEHRKDVQMQTKGGRKVLRKIQKNTSSFW